MAKLMGSRAVANSPMVTANRSMSYSFYELLRMRGLAQRVNLRDLQVSCLACV